MLLRLLYSARILDISSDGREGGLSQVFVRNVVICLGDLNLPDHRNRSTWIIGNSLGAVDIYLRFPDLFKTTYCEKAPDPGVLKYPCYVPVRGVPLCLLLLSVLYMPNGSLCVRIQQGF